MSNAMEEISSKQVREHLAEILNQVAYKKRHYMLTKHGKGVAVIISLDEWQAVSQILERLEDEEDIHDADLAMERIKKGEKTLTHDEMKRALGL